MHLIKDENGNLVQHGHEHTHEHTHADGVTILMLIPTRDLKAMTIHILTSRTAAQAAAPAREETVRMRQWHS